MGVIAAGVAVVAGGAIAGGIIQGKAASKAAKKTNKLSNKYFKEYQRQVALLEKQTEPFIDVGQRAVKTLAGTATDAERLPSFTDTASFKFSQDNLERQIKRSLASKGSLFSGAAIEAEARGNLALSGEENTRNQNLLYNLATLGSNTAIRAGSVNAQNFASTQAAGTALNNTSAQLQLSKGEAYAGAITGATNAIGTGLIGGAGGAPTGGSSINEANTLKYTSGSPGPGGFGF